MKYDLGHFFYVDIANITLHVWPSGLISRPAAPTASSVVGTNPT